MQELLPYSASYKWTGILSRRDPFILWFTMLVCGITLRWLENTLEATFTGKFQLACPCWHVFSVLLFESISQENQISRP